MVLPEANDMMDILLVDVVACCALAGGYLLVLALALALGRMGDTVDDDFGRSGVPDFRRDEPESIGFLLRRPCCCCCGVFVRTQP